MIEMKTDSLDRKIPCQKVIATPDKSLLILSFNSHLQVLKFSTGELISSTTSTPEEDSETNHKDLIRLLLVVEKKKDDDGPQGTGDWTLVSTGEDKLLKTWELPHLRLTSSRELVKRATSIAISPSGKNIVIADKSGDVYDLPFDSPLDTKFLADPDQDQKPSSDSREEKDPKTKTLAPIAGHVSVLTSVEFIPSKPIPLLVTADRDEHIRLSHYPQSWSIHGYLLGHSKFVSTLLWISYPEADGGVLLSGGGDEEVYVWDHSALVCKKRIRVGDKLKDGLRVCPQKSNWFLKSKSKKPEAEAEEQSDRQAQIDQGVNLEIGNKKCCVNKLVYTQQLISKDQKGYVVATSVGSSTCAIIPISVVFEENSEEQVRYHDFGAPILDLVDISTDSFKILASLDNSLGFETPLLKVLDIEQLKVDESIMSNFTKFNENASVLAKDSKEIPTQEQLYPELILFSKDQILNSNNPSHNKSQDLTLENVEKSFDGKSGGRNGKKFEGRLLVQERVQKYLESS